MYYNSIDEEVFSYILENGLRVELIPKMEFNKVYATFTTNYGSINYKFMLDGKLYDQPKGIAHYLEHKMFDMPNGEDVFNRFSKLGANSNAFTSYDKTCYLFSATSNIYECMEILLDFVQTPYFTKESVEKERGIIEQEIKMYDDYPEIILDRGITKLMLQKTPYKYDIAGKVEDIMQITEKDLYDAYKAYYNPSNMVLTVTGNFDKDEMLEFIKNNQAKKTFEKVDVKNIIDEEPIELADLYGEDDIELSIPKLAMGVKLEKGNDLIKDELTLMLYTAMILGESSDNYVNLIKEKIINESFTCSYFSSDYFRIINIVSDSTNPELLKERLIDILKSGIKLDKERFDLIKKSVIGEYIQMFNSLEAINRMYTKYILKDANLFDIIDILNSISLEDVYELSKEVSLKEAACFILK